MSFFRYLCVLAAVFTLTTSNAHAHVRWFANQDHDPIHFEWSVLYLFIALLAAAYSIAIYIIDRKINYLYQLPVFGEWGGVSQWRLLAFSCGITLVFISFDKIFIAPNINLPEPQTTYLQLQLLVGIVLISAIPPRYSGYSVIGVCILLITIIDANIWLDYIFEFLAIGVALCFSKTAPTSALGILRIGLGTQLMVLGVHNKLVDPGLALEFLEIYHWNFVQMLGFTQFDNLAFVFSAGVAEFTFGLLIAIGIATRMVILSIAFFFVLTSTLMGIEELMGHIPLIACCITLFTLGGGDLKGLAKTIWAIDQQRPQGSIPIGK